MMCLEVLPLITGWPGSNNSRAMLASSAVPRSAEPPPIAYPAHPPPGGLAPGNSPKSRVAPPRVLSVSFVTDTQAPAVLFPGQGSQTPEMRDHVARLAPDLLERAIELVGEDPFPRVEESTRFAQPAIFCASVTAYDALGLEPGVAAGHSLGELAALVAAGVLDRDDALELVVLRGRLMAEADDTGSMLALVGATDEEAREIAAHAGVTVANDNAPGPGRLCAVPARRSRTRRGGRPRPRPPRAQAQRRRRVPLAADGAGRRAVPRGARRDRARASPASPSSPARAPQPFTDVRAELAAALTSPVRWRETMLALHEAGATRFVEVGPGKVLARLGKRILTDGPKVETPSLEPANA